MDVYFSPLACSLATRIALDEAGVAADFIEVDPSTHRTLDGRALREVSPLALVPTLRTDAGEILVENAAVLQYVASRFPSAQLAPEGAMDRVRLHQWLSFVGTELHKVVFAPLFDRHAPEGAKAYALTKAPARLDVLEAHLASRDYLLDGFTVADAYLVTVLNWAQATPIDLAKWPAVSRYLARQRLRPSVARSIAIELPLYLEEQVRARRSA
jgi:glutathione S-transferase